jgi:uncharacterized protein YyaL (SSP411 family)
MPGLLAASDLLTEGASVVVAGPPGGDPGTEALVQVALAHPDPALALLRAPDPAGLPPGHPASGKGTVAGAPAAYVCRGGVCSLPVTEPAALFAALARPAAPAPAAASTPA